MGAEPESGDYVRRGEYAAEIRALRGDLVDTERLLRQRDDDKESGLRAEFVVAVNASEHRLHARVDEVDAHLTRQDALLMEKRQIWPSVRRNWLTYVAASVAGALTLHFGFHLG